MPDTFVALAIFALFVLPGSMYIWMFERYVGPWGVALADRALRFVGVSSVIYVIYAPIAYWVWMNYGAGPTHGHPLRWLVQQARKGASPPVWAYFIPLAYVGLPALVGVAAGSCVRSRKTWARRVGALLAGPYPAPRAWDDLFVERPYGLVRGRLQDGTWVGGLFAKNSYASGFPQAPDLYLQETYAMTSDGTFVRDDEGYPVPKGSGLLISFAELQFLETFFSQ